MTDIQIKTIHWLCHGETGLSSKTMAFWLAFDELMDGGRNHPHDPADFDRCLGLLDAVPELRQDLEKMKAASFEWRALVEHWEEIEKSHLTEVGLGWAKGDRAPKTYELMKDVINKAISISGCTIIEIGNPQ